MLTNTSLVAAGVCATLAGSLLYGTYNRDELLKDATGTQEHDSRYSIQSPFSAIDLIESGWDSSGDGEIDSWQVSARDGLPFAFNYVRKGNLNENPEALEWSIKTGEGYARYYHVFDSENDEPDRIVIQVPDWNSPDRHWEYQDIDLDGRIDLFQEYRGGEPQSLHAMVETQMFLAEPVQVADNIYLLTDIDGQKHLARASDGKWRSAWPAFQNYL